MPGDYIRAIDGQSTRDTSVYEGMRLLRGKPGTKVHLTVLRGNAAEPHEIDLVREELPARRREVAHRRARRRLPARRRVRQGHARSDQERDRRR